MRTWVWVSAWEQQCCGQDFAVGSEVTWTVVESDRFHEWTGLLLGHEWGERVRFSEGHHDDEEATLTGVVRQIHEVRCHRQIQDRGPAHVWVPVPSSGWLTDVQVADAWAASGGDPAITFDGWVVELEGA